MQIVYSRSGKSRVVVDLSLPVGSPANDGIPKDTYLDEPFKLCLPSIDAFLDIICALSTGCWLFKKDLTRAYRQLCIDSRDYHLLGLLHHNIIYFDIAPPAFSGYDVSVDNFSSHIHIPVYGLPLY